MTVKELKAELAKWSDDTEVLVDIEGVSYFINPPVSIWGTARLSRVGGGVDFVANSISLNIETGDSDQVVFSEINQ